MKIVLLFVCIATFSSGCTTRRTVVVEEAPRQTIVAEPAGTVHMYRSPAVYYSHGIEVYTPANRLGGNYPFPRK